VLSCVARHWRHRQQTIPWKPQTKERKEVEEEKRRRKKKGRNWFFSFSVSFFFSSWVRRGQNTRCLLLFGFVFFLASSDFSVPCQTVVVRSHSW
jgi:hypothetical protein